MPKHIPYRNAIQSLFTPHQSDNGPGYGLTQALKAAKNQKGIYTGGTLGYTGGNSVAKQPTGLSQEALNRFYDTAIKGKYQSDLNNLERQIASANAMGIQSQNAIGGWGREAGGEIRSAGKRNFGEVQAIQRGVGGTLGMIGGAMGSMGTPQAKRSYLGGAAAAAGGIAGLGAADQGWFNRARDVNAQTTNFYRNDARDQYAQQAADINSQRNDMVAKMASERVVGAGQAKQDFINSINNQQANQTPVADRAAVYASAMLTYKQLVSQNVKPAEALQDALRTLTDPTDIKNAKKEGMDLYFGPPGSPGAKRKAEAIARQQALPTGN